MPQSPLRPADPNSVYHYRRYKQAPKPFFRYGRPVRTIGFTLDLYKQIDAEAKSRGWSFSAMVRHLCEASIEGIE